MHKAPKLGLALIAAAVIALPAVAADKTEKAAKGGVVATVNGVAIPQSLFDAMYAENRAQGMPDSPESRANVRERLVRRELLLQQAKKAGLEKDPAVAQQIDLARQEILIRAFVQDYVRKHPVSDAELMSEYEALKAKMGGTEYKSRHVLVETEDQAKAIIAKLKAGTSFDELAKQSLDTGSKDHGGELGWSVAGAYVPPFAEALTHLAKGKYTETPVKTDFGWHVIELEDTRPLEAPPFEQVKPQLVQRAAQQMIESMVQDLRSKAKVQ